LAAALAATAPGVVVRVAGVGLPPLARALVFGAAIVGASLLLTWSAEVAQLDISPALAIAGLALVALLPEYVVSNVFAWRAGHGFARYGRACQSPVARAAGHDASCGLALANMLGANRLLIGIGWSLVVLLAWHRRRGRGGHERGVVLSRPHSVELAFLAVASLYCLTLPVRGSVSLADSAVLGAVFIGYGWRMAGAPSEDPQLEGVAERLARLPRSGRRLVVAALLLWAALVIFICADAFADALLATGHVLGVGDFFLIQWVAPLASEAPELVVSSVYAWRLRAATGLGALVSSKINQWTLLVASLPVTFAVAAGALHGLPLGSAQRQELALTAAQSVFGVAVLGNLEVTHAEAATIFALFAGEFFGVTLAPSAAVTGMRIAFTVAYLVLGGAILLAKRHDTVALVRDGFRTPYSNLGEPR
jgi:cation:H+ antiporter